MSIQFLEDSVNYTQPNGTQTDYEATITIVFQVNNGGTSSPPYVYSETVTAASNMANLISNFNSARQAITSDVLLEYAAGTPTIYTAPPAPETEAI